MWLLANSESIFRPWSASHWGVLVLLVLVLLVLHWLSRAGMRLCELSQNEQLNASTRFERTRWNLPRVRFLRYFTGGLLVLSWPAELLWVILSKQELSVEKWLPLHLCDVAGFVAAWALFTRSALAISLAVYWGLTLTLQALLTPDLVDDFPGAHFLFFFGSHLLVVIAALWLRLTLQGRLPRGAWWKVALVSQVWFGLSILVNFSTGSNFGYLARRPPNPTLLDHLGPWPWYLLFMNALAVFCWFLLSFLFDSRKLDSTQNMQ